MSTPEALKYANFERITAEEQARILDACIEEFAQHGYALASTNAIVKRAGIPKGTLFYYFGSKKDLYLYVLDHAVTRFVEAFDRLAGELPTDLFERLLHRGRTRMRFVIEHPRVYRLFLTPSCTPRTISRPKWHLATPPTQLPAGNGFWMAWT